MLDNINELVRSLIKEQTEIEWLEFKRDNSDAKMIGRDISALANGALLLDKPYSYMVWRVDDETHQIIGTFFSPYTKLQGNQEIVSWLHGMLSDNARFAFEEAVVDRKSVVVLVIDSAVQYPVAFQKEAYIRVGSYTKRLAEEPALQNQLWDALRNVKFELTPALRSLSPEDIDKKINIPIYFQRLKQKMPSLLQEQMRYLERDGIVIREDNGRFSITNFGAVLLANNLSEFPSLLRKEIRIVQYKGLNRTEISRSKSFEEGYALCIPELLTYLDALLPSDEPILATGERMILRSYPPLAVRELLINALIHQDLASKGNCVVCELFDNRIEITNPGALLVEKERILDFPPKSRNELLARAMRRMNFCEESGTGWDRIAEACEEMHLPAPELVEYSDKATKVILYSKTEFSDLSREQKLWTCYLHAYLLSLNGKSATNATVRERFGLDKNRSSAAARLLKAAVECKLLKEIESESKTGSRAKQYVPYWE